MMSLATVVHKTRMLRESCADCVTVADSLRHSGERDPRRVLRAMRTAHESHKGASHLDQPSAPVD